MATKKIVEEEVSEVKEIKPGKPEVPAKKGKPGTVRIRLFKDNDKYKDDVVVGVNGKFWQIKRGEDVVVPAFVAEVLERSMKQDANTADMIQRLSQN